MWRGDGISGVKLHLYGQRQRRSAPLRWRLCFAGMAYISDDIRRVRASYAVAGAAAAAAVGIVSDCVSPAAISAAATCAYYEHLNAQAAAGALQALDTVVRAA